MEIQYNTSEVFNMHFNKGIATISTWLISSLFTSGNYVYFIIMFGVMVADWIMGVAEALIIDGGLCEKKAFKGVIRKGTSVCLVFFAFLFDLLLHKEGSLLGLSIPANFRIWTLTIIFIFYSEGVSILKHYTKINGNAPKFLEVLLKQGNKRLNDVVEDEEEN